MITTDENKKTYPFAQTLGAIGFAVGIAYTFKTKGGFWKGFWYSALGSFTIGSIGAGIDSFNNKNK